MRTAAALFGLAMAGAVAHAQAPVVVVVESGSRQVAPDAVRAALSEAGIRVVTLLDRDAQQVEATLSIAVQRDGRSATVQLRTPGRVELRFLRAGRRAPLASWLAAPVVAMLRAHRSQPAEEPTRVINPWGGPSATPQTSPPSEGPPPPSGSSFVNVEVLDPWPPSTSRPASPGATTAGLVSEVLDPWSATRRTDAATRAHNVEVLDPWRAPTTERAEVLTAPRPSRH